MIVAAYRMPVALGREREFERLFQGKPRLADMMPGFVRNEFLKPLNGQDYIVLSYWESRAEFDAWNKSAACRKSLLRSVGPELTTGPNRMELFELIGISERILEMKD